jgi:hypothetical protein
VGDRVVGKQDKNRKEIIEEILTRYKSKDYVRGIILNTDAGWEFYVLVAKSDREKRRKEIWKETEVGVNVISIKQASQKILKKLSPKLIRDFSQGELIYSDNRTVPLIKSYAEKLAKERIQPPGGNWQILWRRHLAQLIEEAREAISKDKSLSLCLMDVVFNQGLYFYVMLSGWQERRKLEILRTLKGTDEFLYRLVEDYLHESYPKDKFKILKKIVSYILAPCGGFLPTEWEIPIKVEGVYLEEELDMDSLLNCERGQVE